MCYATAVERVVLIRKLTRAVLNTPSLRPTGAIGAGKTVNLSGAIFVRIALTGFPNSFCQFQKR